MLVWVSQSGGLAASRHLRVRDCFTVAPLNCPAWGMKQLQVMRTGLKIRGDVRSAANRVAAIGKREDDRGVDALHVG
jgi:hypothetical protein